ALLFDAARAVDERQGAALNVRHDPRLDRLVVAGEVALGQVEVRVQDPIRMGNANAAYDDGVPCRRRYGFVAARPRLLRRGGTRHPASLRGRGPRCLSARLRHRSYRLQLCRRPGWM